MNITMDQSKKNENIHVILREMSKKPIIREFIDNQYNLDLLVASLSHPSKDNNEKLDKVFKTFFFEIRFTTYISSLIHYASINFDKKERQNRNRNLLSLDGELHIPDLAAEDLSDVTKISTTLEDIITSPYLFEGIKKLTVKEKQIIIESCILGFSNTEIAIKYKVTQQAISKTRKNGLEKLRTFGG